MNGSGDIGIVTRISQALKQYPPFSLMSEDAVDALARKARVKALAQGEQLWRQGDTPNDELFFLSRGRVEYFWENDGTKELVDVRDVGDLLGLTAIIGNLPFKVHAMVSEDSILYTLPGNRMKTLLNEHDAARHYVRRHLFWETRIGAKVTVPEAARLQGKRSILQSHLEGSQFIRPRPLKRLLTCLPDEPIHQAAHLIVSKRVPSILVVDKNRHPLGVVTSGNLIRHVVVKQCSANDPVSRIMASPVYTVSARSSVTAAVLAMLRERVPQVCVTEDGTANSKALDVCTHKDLLSQTGSHPAGLMYEIRNADTPTRLREICDDIEATTLKYAEAGISGVLIGQICAELYDELTERLINIVSEELAQQGVSIPDIPWAWISVGSDGRREQVLRTDMDNALVFQSGGSSSKDSERRKVFLELANRVIDLMNQCGFSRCQGGVMASNPRWCKSDTEWYEEIENQDLETSDAMLRAVVLFDLRYVAGDKAICLEMRRRIFDRVERNPFLQRRLAEVPMLVPPPLNFWGKFIVEKKGAQAGRFDIKKRCLSPLRDAAQAFAFKYRLTQHYSTGGRYEQIQEAVPSLADTAKLAYEAYDFLLRLRILNGIKHGDAGRYIEPESLSKLERAQLSNVFDVIRMIQGVLRSEFGL